MSHNPSAQVKVDMSPGTIIITKIYEHGPSGLSTKPLELPINPSAGDPKELHTISTFLLSMTLGVDGKILETRARSQDWFIHVDWRYQTIYPKFTTRHRVIPGISPSVRFAGGTAWAENIARNPAFQTPHKQMPVPDYLRRPTRNTSWESRAPPFNPLNRTPVTMPDFTSWIPSPEFPGTPRSMSPGPGDDELSVCSDLTSVGSTVSEITTPRFLSPSPSRQNSSTLATGSINGDWMDQQVQQQFQDEAFLKQKREAENLFARTGDLSGLIAVMEAANKFSAFPSSSRRTDP
ncbi:hypothetical protein B0T21DRAFT_409533 [Apiosordaria backusii]|uniref:Uncharacterized protein n=1 Tax=Apiosordaria backusii TaxID=314023 RepID=A0AA40EI11_9PEZI|nr:hypothetical protein B0T21DRAFT_409533 [Apiosordaria backusii]